MRTNNFRPDSFTEGTYLVDGPIASTPTSRTLSTKNKDIGQVISGI